jgi:hypothetical protein
MCRRCNAAAARPRLGLTRRTALATVALERARQDEGMRVRGVGRIGVALAAAIGLAGCSAGYIYATYGPPIVVALITVGCHTTYEVYENSKERLIMVRTNVGTQIASAVCRDPGVTPTPRRAVEYHFEATNRPKCSLAEERKLSPIHWEYVYSCPA